MEPRGDIWLSLSSHPLLLMCVFYLPGLAVPFLLELLVISGYCVVFPMYFLCRGATVRVQTQSRGNLQTCNQWHGVTESIYELTHTHTRVCVCVCVGVGVCVCVYIYMDVYICVCVSYLYIYIEVSILARNFSEC